MDGVANLGWNGWRGLLPALLAAAALAGCTAGEAPQCPECASDAARDAGADVAGGGDGVAEAGAEATAEATAPEASIDPGPAAGPLVLSFADSPDNLGQDTTGATVFHSQLSWNDVGHLRVRVTAGGKPVAGQVVTYAVVQNPDPGYATLTAPTATTGSDGIADVEVDADRKVSGQFQIEAYLDGDPLVAPLYFDIAVGDWPGLPLAVGFADYAGAYPTLDQAEVLLFKQDGTPTYLCANLAYNRLPQATLAGGTQLLSALTKFLSLPNLQTDVHQTYTVVGLASHGNGPVQAWACDDVQGRVEWGAATTLVTLTLKDIPPSVIGSYAMTSDLDLATDLPPVAQAAVQTVGGFVQDPASQLVLLVCNASAGNSSLAGFCADLFTDPAHPDITRLTATGKVVLQIVQANASALTAAACQAWLDPSQCGTVAWTDLLKAVELSSTFAFAHDPGANGLVTGQEAWTSLGIAWPAGLAGTAPATPGPGIPPGVATAAFTGHGAPAWTMSIDPHDPGIRFGALVDFAIEKFLLPKEFGDGSDGLPAVDNFETAIESLLAGRACLADNSCCTVFANQVAAQTSIVLQNVVQGACNALITVGASWLRSQLVALDVTAGVATFATKVPCNLIDTQNDMEVDDFGGPPGTPQAPPGPCQWDATFTVGGTASPSVAAFWGTRI